MNSSKTIRLIIIFGVGLLLILGALVFGYYYLQQESPTKTSSDNPYNKTINNTEVIKPKVTSPIPAGQSAPGSVTIIKD